MKIKNTVEVYGNTYQIKSKNPRIKVDSWTPWWATLNPGDEYIDESYPGSQFVINDRPHGERIPVNVSITGRTFRSGVSYDPNDKFIRCKVEFVKDGEESVFGYGFVEVE